jgi:hypothetical protein
MNFFEIIANKIYAPENFTIPKPLLYDIAFPMQTNAVDDRLVGWGSAPNFQ